MDEDETAINNNTRNFKQFSTKVKVLLYTSKIKKTNTILLEVQPGDEYEEEHYIARPISNFMVI